MLFRSNDTATTEIYTRTYTLSLHDALPIYRLFSEYRIVQKNEYAYEVVLYPVHYRLPVRVGTSIDADMIEYVMMMLDLLQKEDRIATLSELDFRSGEGVLRSRNEQGETDG